MSTVSALGMYLTGNNNFIAYSTILAAAINIILNILFIPLYGIMAAALSTLAAFIILEAISYFVSQRYYKIPYENWKMYWMILIGVALYVIVILAEGYLSTTILEVIKFILLISYPLFLFFFNLYEKVELDRIHGSFKKWTNIQKLGSNVKEELKKFREGID